MTYFCYIVVHVVEQLNSLHFIQGLKVGSLKKVFPDLYLFVMNLWRLNKFYARTHYGLMFALYITCSRPDSIDVHVECRIAGDSFIK